MSPSSKPPSAPGKSTPEDDGKDRAAIRKAAQDLVRSAGLPPNLAFQVALGNLSLNEVLQRMVTREKVATLMERHGLPKSLATQIALGQADLDTVLRKQRLAAHLDANRERSLLGGSVADGGLIQLSLLGNRSAYGRVLEVGRYEFHFQIVDPKTGATTGDERIHKLQCKLGCLASDAKHVRNQIKRDKAYADPCEPIWKPQERYGCSDRRLFGHIDNEDQVECRVQEGQTLRGVIRWMGRWEFGLEMKKKQVEVVVFRHALLHLGRV